MRCWRRLSSTINVSPGGRVGAQHAASMIPVRSPRDDSILTEIPNHTPGDVECAVQAAKQCLHSAWARGENIAGRCESLSKFADLLRSRLPELEKVETLDCGKPIKDSQVDIETCVSIFEYYACIAPGVLEDEPISVPEKRFSSKVVPHPAGVVACITPWNYPLLQAVVKVAPALAAGCPVLLKPSPLASLTCMRLGEMAEEADLPPGALSVLTGGPPGGSLAGSERLLAHNDVDRVSFTGSGATGRVVLHACAERLRPASLELGGKSALLAFDDADISSLVEWVMLGIFCAAGQVCSATSRLLLHETIAPRVTDQLVGAATALRVGDPLREETEMGPLVSAEHLHRVLRAVHSARSEGCTLLCGGERLVVPGCEDGYYMSPTIMLDQERKSSMWRDEIFGPVLTISTFSTEEEGVRLANDSPYGLAHAVFSEDSSRCERVARQLEAGTVWTNCNQLLWPSTPFGGWKQSGFGREWGRAGLSEYLKHKTIISAPHGCRL